MAKLFANSGDPDQTPYSAASDLGLYCLPITILEVSILKWVKHVHFMYTLFTTIYHYVKWMSSVDYVCDWTFF